MTSLDHLRELLPEFAAPLPPPPAKIWIEWRRDSRKSFEVKAVGGRFSRRFPTTLSRHASRRAAERMLAAHVNTGAFIERQ